MCNFSDPYQNDFQMTAMNDQYERSNTTGPYIPISECITGVRAQVILYTNDYKNRANLTIRSMYCTNCYLFVYV